MTKCAHPASPDRRPAGSPADSAPVGLADLTRGLPDGPPVEAAAVAARLTRALVVLDDDPTGTQSVAGLPVVTRWEEADLAWALGTGAPAVYVMTNSRSLDPADAQRVNREAVTSALAASQATGRPVTFVSRSDSTLRGHFPLEPDTIAEQLEKAGTPVDGIVLSPAFPDAGRVTVHGVHYAGSPGTGFVPVGDTEFAGDATFGYHSSSLPQWVEEKTGGAVRASSVPVVDLEVLRGDEGAVVDTLTSLGGRQPVAVDCVEENDLRLLARALQRAEEAGSTFVYRVGPPFVRARIGQEPHPPLTASQARPTETAPDTDAAGGLVVVGSHVGLTGRQVEALRTATGTPEVVLDVPTVLRARDRDAHVAQVASQAAAALGEGSVVVRRGGAFVPGRDAQESLAFARAVSDAVVEVVQQVVARRCPRFVIAKGGITSSDVASRGLGIRRALVRGPMLPGIVSLWEPQDGPAAGVPYIVFAGNVGDDDSLAQVVSVLSA
ncbi:four-carbon acid sugar kinase family protein [Actinomyces wuliandei]|uniref:four-carbon acid sugar kinase family protein n=1 Tax=Actinomyces wuliandei TaxID=2057743 RepID=UPI001118DF81|nr:four-carbon acid sugar kinase family protein [Actinomyces wuliandei]